MLSKTSNQIKRDFFKTWGDKTVEEFFEILSADKNPAWSLTLAVTLVDGINMPERLIEEFKHSMKLETFVDQAELMKLKLNHFDKLLLAPKRVREILTQDVVPL